MDWLLDHQSGGRGTFVLSSWLFLRALGIIYGIAFISLAVQVQGLIGRHGILPAAELLEQEKKLWGKRRFLLLPSVCWWNCRDGFLKFLCWVGALLSLLLVLGIAPVVVLALLWLFYLSLFTVGRIFLSYQWDILLLETGFLAIFLAPLEMLPSWPPVASPSPVILWLYCWLLFRLMLASGVVKWRSGDPNWRRLRALKYHYETQPLPTALSWYAHQMPIWFHKLSALVLFAIEIVFPFLLFGPPLWRCLAVTAFVLLMLLIMLTGNYCFFNLNTIALCLLALDDSIYVRFLPMEFSTIIVAQVPQWPWWIIGPIALLILVLSLERLLHLFRVQGRWITLLEQFSSWFEPFRLTNSYGLFSVMTTVRLEIIIEGSQDGQTWLPYEFKWKPGDVRRPPRWVQPHQPRLDWQMWFAALGDYHANPWFVALLLRMLQGKPEVLALIKTNPFPAHPPRLIRAVLYEYHFTDWTARGTNLWWRRERRWLYSPVLSLRGREEQFMPPADFRS
jgi:hypothetical protein